MNRRISLLLCCIVSVQGVLATELTVKNSSVLSTIWLNGLDMGTEILFLTEDDKQYLECSVLNKLNINIKLFENHKTDKDFCLVTKNEVKLLFDSSLQAVKLDIPANYFISSSDRILFTKPEKASLGAFLNYNFYYTRDKGDNDFNALSEVGVFKDNWLFKNSVIYRKNDVLEGGGGVFTRLNTSLDFDFSDSLTGLTLGDTTTISNPLINSFRFGGLNWGTNYTKYPDFIYWNVPSLKGSAIVPSTVDLFLNGVNIFRENVTPGDYSLQVGANIQNAGEAQLVVEDVLGNKTVQSFPVLISNQLLQKDLSEYNISLGKIRYNYGIEDSDYRDFFTSLYFRRGITSGTTLGINASYSEDLKNLGLLWTQAVSTYFVVDVVGLASHSNDQKGYSVGLSINKNFGNFSFGGSSRYSSENYKVLGYENNFSMPKWENLLYLGLTDLPLIHNFNLNYVEQRQHQDRNNVQADRKVLTAGFSREITSALSMRAGYFKEFDDQADTGAFLSLTYNFEKNRALYTNYTTDGDIGLNYAQSSSEQVGLNYALGIERRGDNRTFYDIDSLIKTRVGELSLQYVRSDQDDRIQADYQGAMVWLDGHFGLTKSVDNAFALVRVGDYPDIDILRSSAVIGKTNKKGYLFVHDIPAYVKYNISFDGDQLPIDDKVPFSSKKISALDQRGYLIDFPIYHAQKVQVRLIDVNQKMFVAGSEVHVDNLEKDIYPVGTDGLVTLYGLLPGEHKLTVYTIGGKSCQSTFIVAEKIPIEQQNQIIDLVCK